MLLAEEFVLIALFMLFQRGSFVFHEPNFGKAE